VNEFIDIDQQKFPGPGDTLSLKEDLKVTSQTIQVTPSSEKTKILGHGVLLLTDVLDASIKHLTNAMDPLLFIDIRTPWELAQPDSQQNPTERRTRSSSELRVSHPSLRSTHRRSITRRMCPRLSQFDDYVERSLFGVHHLMVGESQSLLRAERPEQTNDSL
jgi:hypothetical protein